jgi:hypothetical protein
MISRLDCDKLGQISAMLGILHKCVTVIIGYRGNLVMLLFRFVPISQMPAGKGMCELASLVHEPYVVALSKCSRRFGDKYTQLCMTQPHWQILHSLHDDYVLSVLGPLQTLPFLCEDTLSMQDLSIFSDEGE